MGWNSAASLSTISRLVCAHKAAKLRQSGLKNRYDAAETLFTYTFKCTLNSFYIFILLLKIDLFPLWRHSIILVPWCHLLSATDTRLRAAASGATSAAAIASAGPARAVSHARRLFACCHESRQQYYFMRHKKIYFSYIRFFKNHTIKAYIFLIN